MSTVAVVGAGIFGCAAAVELARAGHQVDLYERHGGILRGATRAQQGRLHSGYHYPRSPETIAACRDAAPRFAARWPAAIRRDPEHYYAISRRSRVRAGDYLATLDAQELPYEVVDHPLVRRDAVAACVRVPEARVDIDILRTLLKQELLNAGVRCSFFAPQDPAEISTGYTHVVDATYGRHARRRLRYEVVETALMRLGPRWSGRSMVVMDGPFTSVDPYGPDLHMLYDVRLSVHASSVGYGPRIPAAYRSLIDAGPTRSPLTRIHDMVKAAQVHLDGLADGEYVGSMWTVRAVLPGLNSTDARPTLVERDGNIVTVLGGKMCTAVDAAAQVVEAVSACEPVSSRS